MRYSAPRQKKQIDQLLSLNNEKFELRDHLVSNATIIYLSEQLMSRSDVRVLSIKITPEYSDHLSTLTSASRYFTDFSIASEVDKEAMASLTALLAVNKHIIGLEIAGIDFSISMLDYIHNNYDNCPFKAIEALIKQAQHLIHFKLKYEAKHNPNCYYDALPSYLAGGLEDNQSIISFQIDFAKVDKYRVRLVSLFDRNYKIVEDLISKDLLLLRKDFDPSQPITRRTLIEYYRKVEDVYNKVCILERNGIENSFFGQIKSQCQVKLD